jgi:hypothetical protein
MKGVNVIGRLALVSESLKYDLSARFVSDPDKSGPRHEWWCNGRSSRNNQKASIVSRKIITENFPEFYRPTNDTTPLRVIPYAGLCVAYYYLLLGRPVWIAGMDMHVDTSKRIDFLRTHCPKADARVWRILLDEYNLSCESSFLDVIDSHV